MSKIVVIIKDIVGVLVYNMLSRVIVKCELVVKMIYVIITF